MDRLPQNTRFNYLLHSCLIVSVTRKKDKYINSLYFESVEDAS